MSLKQKYVRLEEYDEFIIFPEILQHSDFKAWRPISAGFCYVGKDKVTCFGRSISLDLDSMEDDSIMATMQIHGYDAMINLIPSPNKV